MTIKQATAKMLRDLEINEIKIAYEKGTKANRGKDIAEKIGLTQASYSRLARQVTTPKIQTWYKIILMYKAIFGQEKTEEIINNIE